MSRIASRSIALAVGLLSSGAAGGQTGGPTPVPPSSPPALHVAQPGHDHHHFLLGDSTYRTPGLAVALSLTPLPVDFGNLYAENLGWGVAYTAVEVSLLAPMMWLGGSHMNHGLDDRRWTDGERDTMVGLVAGYVGVKFLAGLHAGYAARAFNRRHTARPVAVVLPVEGGAVVGAAHGF